MKTILATLAIVGLSASMINAHEAPVVDCGLTDVQAYPGYAADNGGWYDTGIFFFSATSDHAAETVTHTRINKVTCEMTSIVIDVSTPPVEVDEEEDV